MEKPATVRDVITAIVIVLIALGLISVLFNANVGFLFFSTASDTFVTYLIIDYLILRDDRERWKDVELEVMSMIQTELNDVLATLTFVSGAQLAVTEYGQNDFHQRTINELRKLGKDLSLLNQSIRDAGFALEKKHFGNTFKDLADRLGNLQLRYWTKFWDPRLTLYVIRAEELLRKINSDINIADKYSKADEETEPGMYALFVKSRDAIYQSIQELINTSLKSLDEGIIKEVKS